MPRHQTAAAGFLFVLSVLAVFEARKLDLGDIGRPGPGFFPFYLALFFALFSLALILRSLKPAANDQSRGQPSASRARPGKVVATLVALIIYTFSLEWLGFLLATFGLMLFLFKAVDPLGWPAAVGGALATSLVSYVVFKMWLQVSFPAGPLGL
ncbi:MAG TPA: tripartite tricarboxylate transporter TctB family protein [Candidatus Binatia bacterium]|nr:tripartite tricarboxylate transporter TctB family protein [Candidatus Binatia bacterium]